MTPQPTPDRPTPPPRVFYVNLDGVLLRVETPTTSAARVTVVANWPQEAY